MMRDVGLVLLAAGSSARMGEAKQMLLLGGVPMLRRAAEAAVASQCRPIVVVSGACAEETREAVAGLPVIVVHNPNWKLGIGTSIHTGLEEIMRHDVEAVVVAMADQPPVGGACLDRLLVAYKNGGLPVVASEYGGNLGVPALFDRDLFHQLLDLPPDEGCMRIALRQSRERVARCACPEAAVAIDTPADYARLAALSAQAAFARGTSSFAARNPGISRHHD